MKAKSRFISIVGIIVILDLLTKLLIRTTMHLGQSIPWIKNILHITYIQNTGAGFGILKGNTQLLIWLSVIVIGAIIYYYNDISSEKKTQMGFALILGGTIGNLIDRISLGYVVDFIDFRIWPAFNVADSCITMGAILLVLHYWRNK